MKKKNKKSETQSKKDELVNELNKFKDLREKVWMEVEHFQISETTEETVHTTVEAYIPNFPLSGEACRSTSLGILATEEIWDLKNEAVEDLACKIDRVLELFK